MLLQKKLSLVLLIFVITVFVTSAHAQINEFTGWGAWFHSQKLSKHWGLHFDAQIRSADEFKYVRNPLIRPGVTYFFAPNKSVTAGYLFTGTHRVTETQNTFRKENRIWEQFIYSHKIQRTAVSHRFRLEQRFVERLGASDAYFAQRLRYFIRGVIPVIKQPVFSKGTYVGLQNEVFANVQNKDKTNGAIFDQNRAYVALGYRFSKKIDLEGGYLNQYLNTVGENTLNHVAQIALYTRF